jgi:superfamily II DNA or RNA helicase
MSTFEYPSPDDPDFLSKIYAKREFYFNKISPRFKPLTQDEITNYRNHVCGSSFQMQSQQVFLANFINPQTPYRGLLIFHGTGSGKTCAAIAIAEQFKEQVEKYNTKIFVLLPGPILKEQFKNELVTICTNYGYIQNKEEFNLLPPDEQKKIKKDAIYSTMKYYNIISYKNFHRRVLGEKMKDTSHLENKTKKKHKYKKTDDGEYEREQSINHIDSLDNTLLIIDEAHNFTDNEYGQALRKIISKSKNLKIILLSATPMKNLPDDIIPLINFLRPQDQPIQRNKVFEGTDFDMKFSPTGKEYLQKMTSGYVSYYKGGNPFTFAERIDIGVIPDSLIFTPVIECEMLDFQLEAYKKALKLSDDVLDKVSESVSNFVFPGIDVQTKKLTGFYSEQGLEVIKNQLVESNKIGEVLNTTFFNGKEDPKELIFVKGKHIGGKIFELDYLKYFSIKFYTCLKNLINMKGIAFIYSNLVQIGVKMFEQVLLHNGYLEFSSEQNYIFNSNTRHYELNINYDEFKTKYPNEKFIPATFLIITGDVEEGMEIPTEKLNIVRNFFNHEQNQNGRFIKFIVGSKVVNEGVTLENVKEIHILDVHYHLGRTDQIIGRGIRHCKHYKSITKDNLNPTVKVYKYVVSLKSELSREIELYRKAEIKYINIKKVERALIEISVDCPINHNANQLVEDVIKYKDCTPIDDVLKDNKNKQYLCPARCEFENCKFKCGSHSLNLQYYDEKSFIYKNINKSHLDFSTFSTKLASTEINFCKEIIKDLFRLKDFYTLDELTGFVCSKYPKEKQELFDVFFIYQALDFLLPVSESEIINFEDFIYNKYNTLGYLIFREKYYIFQPLDEKQSITVQYRSSFYDKFVNELTLGKYINGVFKDKIVEKKQNTDSKKSYDFESNQYYYENRNENDYVGIIDKPPNIEKLLKTNSSVDDVFKLRPKRNKNNIKKREIGLPSIKGATCYTAKNKKQLQKIGENLGIVFDKKNKLGRDEICLMIKNKLLELEKYSTGKDKKTYMIIPYDHPVYSYPLNLEDKIEYIRNSLGSELTYDKTTKNGKPSYVLTVKNDERLDKKILKKYDFVLKENKWITTIS